MLNVKYITTRQPLPFSGYTEVENADGKRIYRNEDVLPKAFFVDSVVTATDPKRVAELMQPGSGFDPATTAIVESEDEITVTEDVTSKISVTSYNSKTIELQTTSDEDGFLVLSEVFYPSGWTATIDGEPIDIYKTNFVLRGLYIPAGEHTISMTFEPASSIWGKRIAWMGHILIWIAGGFVLVAFRGSKAE
jgi:uncharacterized membrane protein YfhO